MRMNGWARWAGCLAVVAVVVATCAVAAFAPATLPGASRAASAGSVGDMGPRDASTLAGPSAIASPPPAAFTSTESDVRGWTGLNETAACTSLCLPADPSVASGNSYVVEAAGSTYRIWTSAGVLLQNASLGSSKLFNTGSDVLLAPQVEYDLTTLRWFITAEDSSKAEVLYGASETSDPTGPWYTQHFNSVPGGEEPAQPQLAVSSLNVVVTTNVVHGSTFEGLEIYVANKTQLLAGSGPATWTSALSATNESVAPAEPAGNSALTYFATDGLGGERLDVFDLSGSPPATPVLSTPESFPGPQLAPPNAPQAGSVDLVATGSARVQSAVLQGGDLWAIAGVSCTPSGDSVARACLHLWEIALGTETVLQNFNWSTGPGTYDYDPAISVDSAGNAVVVFESSTSTTDPSVWTAAESAVAPRASFSLGYSVKLGSAPDNVTGECASNVCPFGNYSSIALVPLDTGNFWLAGEYIAGDRATDPWHTWVEQVSVSDTYPVNLSEANLPAGTSWSVTVDGSERTSTTPTMEWNETNGTYSFGVGSPVEEGPGIQFVASPAAGTFTVAGAATNETIPFVEQFNLTTSALPIGGGTISPAAGWFDAGAPVELSAVAASDHAFVNWSGEGNGSYSGSADPSYVVMNAPLSETANFSTATTYAVTLTATGLASGLTWGATLNGVTVDSTSISISFNEPNGSYSYSASPMVNGSVDTRYLAAVPDGSLHVDGAGVSAKVAYGTEFSITLSASPAADGSIAPASGWYPDDAQVVLTALPAAGYRFVTWEGTGTGNYSGTSDPANLTVGGPVTEVANFTRVVVATAPPTPSSSGAGSGIPLWELEASLAALAAALGVVAVLAVGARRRRNPPSPPPGVVGSSSTPSGPPSPVTPPVPAEPWQE
jgi:hypothetical protein